MGLAEIIVIVGLVITLAVVIVGILSDTSWWVMLIIAVVMVLIIASIGLLADVMWGNLSASNNG